LMSEACPGEGSYVGLLGGRVGGGTQRASCVALAYARVGVDAGLC
jgi:hypothetical protein